MEDTTNTQSSSAAPQETPSQAEKASKAVSEAKAKVKEGFGKKFKGFFGKSKDQFVRLVPSEQITVMVGVLLVILSIFDSYLTRAMIAIVGLVMIMVAFAGVKLNNLGQKKPSEKTSTPNAPKANSMV